MKAVKFNDASYYNLTDGATLPDWLSQTKKASLAKEQKRRRVELLQDLEFKGGAPMAIEVTADQGYMWIAGEYPSHVRCYDLNEVCLKFSRYTETPIVSMQPISDDYKKIAFLQRDRWLEFHGQGGRQARVRAPKEGRSILYDRNTANMVMTTSCSSVYYFDLDGGAFLGMDTQHCFDILRDRPNYCDQKKGHERAVFKVI